MRRWLKGLLWAGAVVLVLVLVTAAGAGWLLGTEGGRARLVSWIEDAAGGDGLRVKIGRIGPGLPGHLAVENVTVADAGSVWLEVPTAVLDWAPLDLLFARRLTVDGLRLRDPVLHRLPETGEAPPEPDDGDTGLPTLPIDLRINGVAIENARLGAPVVGQDVTLTLRAQAAWTRGGPIDLALDTRVVEGPAGSLRGALRYTPGAALLDGTLAVDLKAAEPAGGALAALLGLPATDGLTLDVDGKGPLTAWAGTLRAQAGARRLADLTARTTLGERWRADLSGSLDPAPLLPAEVAPLLAGTSVKVGADSRPDLTDLRLDLRLDGTALALAGTAALATLEGPAKVDLTAAVKDRDALAPLVPGLALDGANLALRGEGPLLALPVAVEVEAEAVDFQGILLGGPRLSARLRPATDWTGDAVDMDAELALASLAGVAEGDVGNLIAGPWDGTVTGRLDLAANTLRLSAFDLGAGFVRLAGAGGVDLGTTAADATATLALPDLAAFAPVSGLALSGNGMADIAATLDADGAAHGEVTLRLDKPSLGDPALDPLLAPLLAQGVDLSVRADWSEAVGVAVPDLQVQAGPWSLNGTVNLGADYETLSGSYALRATDLSGLNKLAGGPVRGRLNLEGTLSGTLDNLSTKATLGARGLEAAGIALPRLDLRADAAGLPAAPRGQVSIDGESPYGPLSAATRYALSGDTLRLDGFTTRLGGAAARGDVAVNLAGPLATGSLALAVPDLAALKDLTGTDLAGSAEADLLLAGDDGRQAAQVLARVRDLAVATTKVASVDLDARADMAPGGSDLTLSAEATARDVAAGTATVKETKVDARGTLEHLLWTVTAAGRLARPFAAAVGGDLRPGEAGAYTVGLASLEARSAGQAIALKKPTTVTLGADGSVALAPTELDLGGGTLGLRARLGGGSLEADIQGQNLPLALAQVAAPDTRVAGTLDLGGEVRLTPGTDAFEIRLNGKGLRAQVAEGTDFPPADLEAKAVLKDGQLKAFARASGPLRDPLLFEATLPMARATPEALPAPVGDGPVRGTLAWKGDLAEVEPFIPAAEHRIAGQVAVELGLAGTVDDPRLSGRAAINGGAYEHLVLGTRATDLTLTAEGDSSGNLAVQATAGDGGNGRLAANATVALAEGGPKVDADLKLENFHVVRRDDADALASGELDLAMAGGGGKLTGRVVFEPVELRLLNNLPESVVVLEVSDGKAADPDAADAKPAKPLVLDLTIDMPRRTFVRGRGVDSEWRGSIKVGGTAADPLVNGAIENVRGQVSALGKLFRITTGTVKLDGAQPPDPIVNLVAETEANDLTVILKVTGRASSPSIALSSEPALPRDEILSRLLFDKSAGSLGPAEAIALADAAASLTSGSGGMMDRIRAASGLDVLRTGTGADGGTRVSAGKYVSEGVYVGVNQGLQPGSGSVSVEIDITKSLSVESELGSNATGSLGLNWSIDY